MHPIPVIHRAFGMLVIFFVLGGLCLDTLDLTQDIQLSDLLTVEQQGIEPEDVRDDLPTVFYAALPMWWGFFVVTSLQSAFNGRARFLTLQLDRPLYQRLCTYRI